MDGVQFGDRFMYIWELNIQESTTNQWRVDGLFSK